MTKKELFFLLSNVPDDAEIRTSDDLSIISVKVFKNPNTLKIIVWLEDSELYD